MSLFPPIDLRTVEAAREEGKREGRKAGLRVAREIVLRAMNPEDTVKCIDEEIAK